MNDFTRPTAYYGQSSTVSRMQQHYWTTKQAFLRKFGRKEDDCIIASDAELDAKLELFGAIQDSCTNLLRVLENYQDRILALSQEENALGRFLKECGKQDKTRAGKMMGATGKSMSYSAQQRLTLRVPLVRLYQEVETYQFRAIADTLATVEKMERARTDYRGALLWMKDISQQLDPDTYKQLEKFRKVQGHVKRTKMKFEKLKLDTLQKVDLLAASRCNMFSHVLAAYQNALLAFWEKTSSTMTNVAESFKGYQHYDFIVVKELQEPSRKLAEEMGNGEDKPSKEDGDKDRMLFFDSEYRDDDSKRDPKARDKKKKRKEKQQRRSNDSCTGSKGATADIQKPDNRSQGSVDDVPLLNLDEPSEGHAAPPPQASAGSALPLPPTPDTSKTQYESSRKEGDESSQNCAGKPDLLTHNPEVSDMEKDDMTLLTEILNSTEATFVSAVPPPSEGSFTQQWQSAFGDLTPSPQKTATFASLPRSEEPPPTPLSEGSTQFLPSHLLDLECGLAGLQLDGQSHMDMVLPPTPVTELMKPVTTAALTPQHHRPSSLAATPSPSVPVPRKTQDKKDMSAWFSLFADLDPLANPDAIGKKSTEEDRNC
ncbi:islet cell autoantigen 1-like isoform X2 [Ornithodoros turicata]|uniref:islet cell autoantigen 1-like isoform X2 n=1 Tax=Ornithodoros turicata TaxID=34597 RepID=UPI00313953A3